MGGNAGGFARAGTGSHNGRTMKRGVHDIGGLPGGPVDQSEHDSALWEKRIDVMLRLLMAEKNLMRVDELRRGIESLKPDAYQALSYYERWIASIALILVEKGVLDQGEIDRKIEEIKGRAEAAE